MMVYVLAVLLPSIPLPGAPTGLSVLLLALWKFFDVFVIGTIQAFIFMLLTIVYFEMAREGLEEEHGSLTPETHPAASPATGGQLAAPARH